MIKAVLVDDEIHCLEALEDALHKLGQVTVMVKCLNTEEAKTAIQKENPDILFLDVELQDHTGFELLEEIKGKNIDIIFTTAY